VSTIRDFERGHRQPIRRTVAALRLALERAGIVFGAEEANGVWLEEERHD
jgi:hypothetical protein